MNFKLVLRTLLEVFPQVDLRILKAVAIEHANDVDAAVEFVMSEVLPALSDSTWELNKPSDTQEIARAPSAEVGMQDTLLEIEEAKEENASQFGTSSVVENDKSNSLLHDQTGDDSLKNSPSSFIPSEPVITPDGADNPEEQVASVERISRSFQASDENTVEPSQDVSEFCVSEGMKYLTEIEEPLTIDLPQSENTSNLLGCGSLSNKVDESCLSGSQVHNSKDISENDFEMVGLETDASLAPEMPTLEATQSRHKIVMDVLDVLEDFITDAKSDKETLLSAFESLCNIMRDVEFHEERAKLAKEVASEASVGFLLKAENMRQMLIHAKGANEMRAGELFGEKATLAAEARELQSQLLSLSEEKEKSLSIIQEIQQTLEARLAAAIEGQNAAEQEKLQREEAARSNLKEQEVSMDEIEQESRRIKQEAVENAKLREFLVQRGGIVDKLQGEIAVISEDVLRQKERVDGHVPLDKYPLLTFSLASSSSSFSNQGRDKTVLPIEVESQKVGTVSHAKGEDEKAFSDDDWELLQ